MNIDFDPVKVFTVLDFDQDGVIDASDISKFLKNQYIRISDLEASLIIKEFDGNLDGNLDF